MGGSCAFALLHRRQEQIVKQDTMQQAKGAARTALCLTTVGRRQDDGISAFPDADNIQVWAATISGSKDTPYEGGHAPPKACSVRRDVTSASRIRRIMVE